MIKKLTLLGLCLFLVLGVSSVFNRQTEIVVAETENTASQEQQASEATPPKSCEEGADFAFNWILCPLLEGATSFILTIEELIYDELEISESDYANQEGFKSAWTNMRNLATYAIVGTALFMVLATALEIQVVSNYTVKKYLPRLVVGTILIQFSWAVGDIMIQFINTMAYGFSDLIFQSFPDAKGFGLQNIFSDNLSLGIGSGAFVAYIAINGLGALSTFAAIMLPVVMGFLVGWLSLVIRKYVIILLLIFSPLGVALWILPGSDRAWRTYYKTFFYLLLVYPIIRIVLASAKVFSYLIMNPGG